MSKIYEDLMPYETENFSELLNCLKMPLTGATIRRIFLLLVRAHYSHGGNYPVGYEHLKCMVWNPDPKASTLTVETLNFFNDMAPDAFPGIYVGISGNTSDVNMIGGGFAALNDDWSQSVHSSQCVATVTVRHITRNEGDSYDMADMTMSFLQAMAPFIAEDMQASGIRVKGYSAADKKLQPSDRFYAVDLSAQVTYNNRVATILEGHRIGSIQIAVGSTESPS